jgi:hypothetical protein
MTRLAAPTVRTNVATTSVPSLEIRAVLLTILSIDVSPDQRNRANMDAINRPRAQCAMPCDARKKGPSGRQAWWLQARKARAMIALNIKKLDDCLGREQVL